jgi:glutamate/tyrosine decarboxylase-like PLP-dependent enzyme
LVLFFQFVHFLSEKIMKNEPFIGSGLIEVLNKSVASKCSKVLNRTPASRASIDLTKEGDGERQVAAWFLGPRAENLDMFMKLVEEAITDHAYWRRNFHPEDPTVISDAIQRETGYLDAVARTKSELFKLLAQLKGSVPFSSMRYQGHMCWDQTIPGMVAYVAAMLYNQNNTATEASPVTTVLEYLVGQDLCRMFGYRTEGEGVLAWGHLTCGGTTANIEAQWAARNAKYYPVAIKKAVESGNLPGSEALEVTLSNGSKKPITDLNSWELLNLTLDETLALPERVIELILPANPSLEQREQAQQLLEENTAPYLLQNAGLLGIYSNELLPSVDGKPIQPPVFFVPASKHYSLPKGAAILGVGGKNLRAIPLNRYGRMDTTVLQQELEKCQANFEPVIGVTAVFGTTEEGNVDPLQDILNIRTQMRAQGFDFAVHADGAWGGYFASMLPRYPTPKIAASTTESGPALVLPMSSYVYQQYLCLTEADTITVDPHKTGYLPYPAGALCYRNKLMRSLVAFSAPYTNTGQDSNGSDDDQCRPNTEPDYPEEDLVMGLYGIEGSKPGAAAAGVYLSHAVIPTDPSGYGTLLGRTLFNCKLFHLALLGLNEYSDNFYVEPVPHTEIEGGVNHAVLKSLHGKSYNDFIQDSKAMEVLKEQGADLNIVCFAFNFKDADGNWNTSLAKANEFNKAIFDRCGVKLHDNIHDYRFVTSATSFPQSGYGEVFFNDYAGRLLKKEGTTSWDADSISVMRSVIMDPWLTESRDGEPFLKEVVAELGAIVCEVVRDMGGMVNGE